MHVLLAVEDRVVVAVRAPRVHEETVGVEDAVHNTGRARAEVVHVLSGDRALVQLHDLLAQVATSEDTNNAPVLGVNIDELEAHVASAGQAVRLEFLDALLVLSRVHEVDILDGEEVGDREAGEITTVEGCLHDGVNLLLRLLRRRRKIGQVGHDCVSVAAGRYKSNSYKYLNNIQFFLSETISKQAERSSAEIRDLGKRLLC